MRMVMAATAVCLLPAAVQAQSRALPLTVSDMQRACGIVSGGGQTASPEEAVAAGACYGAIRGVVQVMKANCRSFGAGQRPAPALSRGHVPSAGDAIAAFDAWVDENPDEADAPAEYGIIVALAQAFPCRPSTDPAPTSGDAAPSSEGSDGTEDVQSE